MTTEAPTLARDCASAIWPDRIDARALARYGAERGVDLARYRAAPESQRQFAAALTRREKLVAMRVAETNRSRQPLYADPTLARSLAALLATLNSEIASLEARAASLAGCAPHPRDSEPRGAGEPSGADAQASNAPSSWPPWPPETTTPPCAPCSNASSTTANPKWSPSSSSCAKASSSQTQESEPSIVTQQGKWRSRLNAKAMGF
jgi:hypothetical protein